MNIIDLIIKNILAFDNGDLNSAAWFQNIICIECNYYMYKKRTNSVKNIIFDVSF